MALPAFQPNVDEGDWFEIAPWSATMVTLERATRRQHSRMIATSGVRLTPSEQMLQGLLIMDKIAQPEESSDEDEPRRGRAQ